MRDAAEKALALIEKIIELAPRYRALDNAARELQGDFSSHHSAIDECVYGQVIALVDATLGDDEIGSYFLHECQSMKDGGSVTEAGGRHWPIKTMADLRAYVEHTQAAARAGGGE